MGSDIELRRNQLTQRREKPSGLNRLLEAMNRFERHGGLFFSQTLPAYLLVRTFLGLIYFWFGLLKFNFVPGQSPAEDLIRTVWGPYLNADTFIRCLAIFETGAGLLLLLNFRSRLIALLLCGHVLGTFSTVILDPGSAIHLDIGFFSLTLVGQYILKNLLILSSCFFLMLEGSRESARKSFRVTGTILLRKRRLEVFLTDLSEMGVGFLAPAVHDLDFSEEEFLVEFASPLGGEAFLVPCRGAWASAFSLNERIYYRVGCRFADPQAAERLLFCYFFDDWERIVAFHSRESPVTPLKKAS